MPTFKPSPCPTSTPWGGIDSADQVHAGIWSVTTPSHGGFILSPERQAAMPESLRLSNPIYEEDADYALVILGFEAEFNANGSTGPLRVRNAHDTVRNWHPIRYSAFTGKAVEPRESHVLAQRDAYRERIGRAVVVAAFGSWADWVPAGKTGVIARTLTGVDQLGRASYAADKHKALVDADRYEARGRVITLDELDAVPC
jgi:hypothetical protein